MSNVIYTAVVAMCFALLAAALALLLITAIFFKLTWNAVMHYLNLQHIKNTPRFDVEAIHQLEVA